MSAAAGLSVKISSQCSIDPQPGTVSTSGLFWNNKVLAAILGMVIGTGGVANAAIVNTVMRSNSTASNQMRLTICPSGTEVNRRDKDALLPQEQIAGIQRYLSLNVTDLSRAIRVKRPTVYSWLRGVQPHDTNMQRIQQLYLIARSWRAMSSSPIGAYLSAPLQAGGSLMVQLTEEFFDEGAINRGFAEIKAALSDRPRRESIVEVANRRGLSRAVPEPTKTWSDDDEFDL